MGIDVQDGVEFDVTDAWLEFDPAPEVDHVVFETDKAPEGRITTKLRKEVKEDKSVDGMGGKETHEVMLEASELPENVKNIVRKAQDMDEPLTCVATVGMNENDKMFILQDHIETLEARLLQDDRDE